MLIFITGVAGSGKSTLCENLAGRGLRAYDADDEISRHVRIADGVPVASPPRHEQTPQWVREHEFRFDLGRLCAIAAQATPEEPAFVLGAAYGDCEAVKLADLAFYLHVDRAELGRRLAGRSPDAYGSAPHELESIFTWHASAADRYERLGARRLDASRPAGQIADELLAVALGAPRGTVRG